MKRRRAGLSGSPAGGGIAVRHGTCPRTHRGIGARMPSVPPTPPGWRPCLLAEMLASSSPG